jgi:sterol desaturase/sphingolipid hydroxylase (fatty acid hydroxylase superfamily)
MTAVRTHPLSERFEQLGVIATLWIPMGIIMYLFHLNYVEIALLLATGQRLGGLMTLEVLHHTQFPVSYGWLDYIIVSPRVHQAHHSADYEHWDHNIGIRLAIWDLMCGTLVLPPRGSTAKSGIGRGEAYDQRYHTFYGAFIQSVIDSGRVLFGLPVAELPPPTSLVEKGLVEPVKNEKRMSRVILPPAE